MQIWQVVESLSRIRNGGVSSQVKGVIRKWCDHSLKTSNIWLREIVKESGRAMQTHISERCSVSERASKGAACREHKQGMK